MTLTRINLITAVFWVLLCNLSFFRHVLGVYPLTINNSGFLLSLALGLTAFIFLFLTLVTARLTYKPILTLLLIAASATTYFMDYYHVVIDHTMIRNIVETNVHEAMDLFSPKLLGYVMVLGILPSLLLWKSKVTIVPWRRALLCKVRDALIATVTVLGLVLLFSRFYASFFREHKPLRYYTNPTYMLYSIGKYANKSLAVKPKKLNPLGTDAHLPPTDLDRELIILVIGESARADHFSLNGYHRPTNPRLQQDGVISFRQMYSSGTSTAFSVPCMFSNFPRDQFSERKGEENENLLDVLRHAGVNVLWRENNSDSKGVAVRVPYMDYKTPKANPLCENGECRDEGMLIGLQEYIDAQPKGDITIVLHQMGNHGPAYYKRYPKSFERFTPTCKTNQLEECSNEEIGNTYDNAILYTDYFLDKVISLLKKNSDRFETAMFYMSDHGESLGEYGIYLHSLPYSMAPEAQKHVASVLWFGDSYKIDQKAVAKKADQPFSHANFFHTVLGLMEIETSAYNKNLDILNGCIPSS
ncbi:MAG: phosphoethanolamine transferase [Desulfobulbus sp.]